MKKIFIDGSSGTTGLRIESRLSARDDIKLIKLDDSLRKDISAKKDAINSADIVFLCLPDDAARESVALCENPDTAIIDTSTAHRTSEGWVYGFPEIKAQREKIAQSKRVANPGCHASGFIALVKPLIEGGIISKDEKLSCFSLTGYSGGGKKMIAQYEDENRDELLKAPRMYGLSQAHKHLPEMKAICGLDFNPVFCPVVAPYYAGMETVVSLFDKKISDIEQIYSEYYNGGLVKFVKADDGNVFLSACAYEGKDTMSVGVYGQDDRLTLVARFDNLGKGASGAAIQNMNIILGIDEAYGLVI